MQATLINLFALMLLALGLNLPLGHLRARAPKFSLRWFVCIHLSIPLIVWARTALGYGWQIIPLTLGSAVLGQYLGARLHPPGDTNP